MNAKALTPIEMKVIIERTLNPMIPLPPHLARQDLKDLLRHLKFLATQLKESQESLEGLKLTLMALCRRETSQAIEMTFAEVEAVGPKDELHGEDRETEAGPVKILRYIPHAMVETTH